LTDSSITTNRKTGKPLVGIVREWVIVLGVLTAGNMSRAEAEMKLRAYVPLLQDQFPAGAFTQESLHAVAAQCKWFPSYAEVIQHLRGWWREHRPAPPALPPPAPVPPRQPPTEAEIAHVHACVQQIIANMRSPFAERSDMPGPVQPRYASPELLDRINPLPGGRKRHAPEAATASNDQDRPVDPDAA
jgi:hypothetical protein